MSNTSQPLPTNTEEKKGINSNLMTLYFGSILLAFVVASALPFLESSISLETREVILDGVWIFIGLSQLILPFTVKEKKKRTLAFILAIIIFVAFVANTGLIG